MSLKTLLLPIISRRLFSRERLLHKRAKAEQKRVKAQAPHQLHYFHQVDDPYSALVAGVLPTLLARYHIELVPHVVSAPPDAAAPERDKLVAYSRVDAERLACTMVAKATASASAIRASSRPRQRWPRLRRSLLARSIRCASPHWPARSWPISGSSNSTCATASRTRRPGSALRRRP